jgi:flavin-dependent dehydrogenase
MLYDVIIIGAGPAGGECARALTKQGKCVALVEKAKNFQENNYSSGGAPLQIMQDFDLPHAIVGSYWNRLNIHSTKIRTSWQSESPFGPILDFDRLRAFLAEETFKKGGDVFLGHHYQHHVVQANHTVKVTLKNSQSDDDVELHTRVLVDATGSGRKVLSSKQYSKNKAMAVTGIEQHIQVSPAIYQQFKESLNFYLGHHWMPQGYAWIFPMAPCQLKVGVIRYFQNEKHLPYQLSYRYYLDQMLTLCGDFTTSDKHGKTIYYTFGQKDRRYEGPVLAIGDAISTINPLGCEGIRHAMVSGRLAAIAIEDVLNQQTMDFHPYHQAIKRYFGWRWTFSEILMKSLFKRSQDALIDHTVKCFSAMNNQQIMDVIFNYRFSQTLPAYLKYFTLK